MLETVARKPEKFYPSFEPLADTLERVVGNITNRTGTPEFKTGLRVLDEGIFGLHRSQMTVIAARPGVGKTSFAVQVAMNCAKAGHKVAFLSLEMTKESVLERIFCIEEEVDGFALMRGKAEGVEGKISRFVAATAPLPLRIIDDYCHTENELFTLIEHLEFRPDVLILDHIQHIRALERKSQWEALTEYFRYLKELAMKYQIAVMVLSQINRQGTDLPSLANLKGSGAIEEMSDQVLLFHKLENAGFNENNFHVEIAKSRYGPLGSYQLFFKGQFFKFYNDHLEYLGAN